MKGLELARAYYEAHGKRMLKEQFPEVFPRLAVGLVGSGSECYGYDDALSQDHDFEPCFCIFLPGEDVVDRRTAFLLERAYAKLPKEFMGLKRSPVSPVGGDRHGVIRMEDFFLSKTGTPDGVLSVEGWFSLPEYALLEATAGEVFEDPYGRFTQIRAGLRYFPEDVRRKKLAGRLLLMGQAGQYNFPRCLKRGDTAAAQLAVFEFAKSAIHCAYLLRGAYLPYYKWQFRGLRELSGLGGLAEPLETLISSPNTPDSGEGKLRMIEEICGTVCGELRAQELLSFSGCEMERCAYAVNDTVSDPAIRNLHVLYGV
ncbi:MAG: DUF4037 domain-containing protein [Clostridia bacterium]|nr:DUF4037 domain-containing protein [Clostridia bacterium]